MVSDADGWIGWDGSWMRDKSTVMAVLACLAGLGCVKVECGSMYAVWSRHSEH